MGGEVVADLCVGGCCPGAKLDGNALQGGVVLAGGEEQLQWRARRGRIRGPLKALGHGQLRDGRWCARAFPSARADGFSVDVDCLRAGGAQPVFGDGQLLQEVRALA
jgi:hypothetical protein